MPRLRPRTRGAAGPLRGDRHAERRGLADRRRARARQLVPPAASARRARRDRRERRPADRLRRRPRDDPGDAGPAAPTDRPPRACRHRAAFNATGVKPVVHRGYDGGAIRFADAPDLVLSPASRPTSAGKVGDDIVTASGTTLLGADDKAGVAIVMTAARHLLANPEIAHGPIRIAFTPDEEIGRGVHPDLPRDLAAPCRLHLRRRRGGEVSFETFSADKAVVASPASRSIRAGPRTGWSTRCTSPRRSSTPCRRRRAPPRPPTAARASSTSTQCGAPPPRSRSSSSCATSSASGLAAHGALLPQVAAAVAATEPRARSRPRSPRNTATCATGSRTTRGRSSSRSQACRDCGVEPFSEPVRGGTDGSRLTELGVPMPQPLHRHADGARPARMDQRPGHGRGHRRLPAPRRALGRARRRPRLTPPAG